MLHMTNLLILPSARSPHTHTAANLQINKPQMWACQCSCALPLCNAYVIHEQKQWGSLHLANPIIIYGWPNLIFLYGYFTQYWHACLSTWVGWVEDGSHSQQWPTTVIHRVLRSVQSTMPHTIHPIGLQVSGMCGKLMLKDTSLREFFKFTSSTWNGILGHSASGMATVIGLNDNESWKQSLIF